MSNVCKLTGVQLMYQFAQYGVIGAIIAAATMYHRVVVQERGTSQQLADLKGVYCTAVSFPRLINTFTISASSNRH